MLEVCPISDTLITRIPADEEPLCGNAAVYAIIIIIIIIIITIIINSLIIKVPHIGSESAWFEAAVFAGCAKKWILYVKTWLEGDHTRMHIHCVLQTSGYPVDILSLSDQSEWIFIGLLL